MEILGVITTLLRAAAEKRPDGSFHEFPGEAVFSQNPLLHKISVGHALGFRKHLFLPLALQVAGRLVPHVAPQKRKRPVDQPPEGLFILITGGEQILEGLLSFGGGKKRGLTGNLILAVDLAGQFKGKFSGR